MAMTLQTMPEALPGWTTAPPPAKRRGRPPWRAVASAVADLMAGMWCGKQRQFARLFSFHAGLCQPGGGSWSGGARLVAVAPEAAPCGAGLSAAAAHFLGPFMVRDFDLLQFLEDCKLWTDQASDQDSDEDEESQDIAEQKYARAVYEAAALAVAAVLRRLIKDGFYREPELADALALAAEAVTQLPNSMVLVSWLPGPLNAVKDSLADKATGAGGAGGGGGGSGGGSGSGGGQGSRIFLARTRDWNFHRQLESEVRAKFAPFARRFNFERTLASLAGKDLKVVRSAIKRMHVASIRERRLVHFRPCLARDPGHSFTNASREELTVEFDPEVAELLSVGMVLTGTFNLLSDGSWCFTQAGYVWPSYHCTEGCLCAPPPSVPPIAHPQTSGRGHGRRRTRR